MPVEGNAVLEDASAMAGITTSPQSRESPMQRTSTMRHRN
jgi:hypothetical protein